MTDHKPHVHAARWQWSYDQGTPYWHDSGQAAPSNERGIMWRVKPAPLPQPVRLKCSIEFSLGDNPIVACIEPYNPAELDCFEFIFDENDCLKEVKIIS